VSPRINVKPGATKVLKAKLILPADLTPGTYTLVIDVLPGVAWTDPDGADNTATATVTVA
jgi:hypothetical protein